MGRFLIHFFQRVVMGTAKGKNLLRLVCKCGYRKKIPDKYAGKKVVCPKCTAVLVIERIRKVADLLARCPYCKDIAELNPKQPGCVLCEREFDLPVSIGDKTDSANAPPKAALPVESVDDGPLIAINDGSDSASPNMAIYRRRRRPILATLIANLIGFAIIGSLGYLLWEKYGEELGLPPLSTFSKAESQETAPEPAVLKTTPEETAEKETKPLPKLTSPCIEVLAIEKDVAQALDPKTNEVLGHRLFVSIKFRNISQRELTKVETGIQLVDGPIERKEVRKEIPFKKPIPPNETRFVDLTFPVQTISEARIKVKRVWSGKDWVSSEAEKKVNFED